MSDPAIATTEPASLIRQRDPCGSTLILRDTATKSANAPFPELRSLLQILSWKRPYDTAGEALFAAHYLDCLAGMHTDDFGNRHLTIPYADGSAPRVAWSCHIDTCHHEPGYQRLVIRQDKDKIAYVETRRGEGNCLGADDGTGVWLMLEMIRAGKPGRYLFHRGEERGCLGSKWIADHAPELVRGIDAAIALDRRDFDNIITHQGGERCCSEAFAKSLGAQIPGYRADPTGSFTDTKSYVKLIPECTNLSVGYQSQHGPMERQYLTFLWELRTHLLALDLTALTIARDPTAEPERRTYGGTSHNSRNYDAAWNYGDGDDGPAYSYSPGYVGSNSNTRDTNASNQPAPIYRLRMDPENRDPNHWCHEAFSADNTTYCWSKKFARNIRRDLALFEEGVGYVPATFDESKKWRELNSAPKATKPDADTLPNTTPDTPPSHPASVRNAPATIILRKPDDTPAADLSDPIERSRRLAADARADAELKARLAAENNAADFAARALANDTDLRDDADPMAAAEDQAELEIAFMDDLEKDLHTLCEDYPETAADLLTQCGVTPDEFLDLLYPRSAGRHTQDEISDEAANGDDPADRQHHTTRLHEQPQSNFEQDALNEETSDLD